MACNGRALERATVHQGTVAALSLMLPSTLGAGNVSPEAASACVTRYAVGPLLLAPLSPSSRARAPPDLDTRLPRGWPAPDHTPLPLSPPWLLDGLPERP